jgi:malate dehydrogenase
MDRIVILGAGEIGGLLAHALARRAVAHDIQLVDDNGRAAAGKALDIMQAAPVEGFSAAVGGSSDASLAGGATVVVIADAIRGGEWQGEAALALTKRVRDFAPKSLVVCAGASHRDLIERAVRELHFQRSRVIGSAPEALVSGIRGVIAAASKTSPRDVAVTALGVPPAHIVVPWEDATVGGFSVIRTINEPDRRRIEAEVTGLWPPGPYALASAAAKVVDTMLGRSDRLVTCFVAPDDSAGRRTRASAVPVRLNRTGLTDVVLPELTGRDRVRLENAMLL